MFKKLSDAPIAEVQNAQVAKWKEEDLLTKCVTAREGATPFVFYEGPPTANGKPGIHHVMARTLKDSVCRYKTMQGYQVNRKAGWDTHGLPVEIEVEKQLGMSGKQDIEKYGIKEFNQKCKESVFTYTDMWRDMTERMGYLVDLDDPYITLDNNYIETGWWILKKFFDAGMIYEGHKILPYCPRCGTGLASHEVAQGYKEVKVNTLICKFKKVNAENEYFLAWTTTPWTLASNVALTCGPDIDYIKAKMTEGDEEGNIFYVAKALADKVLGAEKYEVLEEMKGYALEYMEYEQLMPFVKAEKKAFFMTCMDYVSVEDGTGIVHTAPAFGEDDYNCGRKYDLPVLQHVDEQGCYTATPWVGRFVMEDGLDVDIIKYLAEDNKIFKKEKMEHNYPHCWRCGTPLVYYANKSWYIEMTKLRDELVANNNTVNWYPPYVGEKRFGNWLEDVKDWAISRSRYWGTPIPIWKCECGHLHCVGSREQLIADAEQKIDMSIELHRPYVDDVTIKCPECGKSMHRIPEVMDCWFDSGAMPFAQWHYPFENSDKFDDELFPADFICEGIDQTRGWFYSLIAISTVLFGRSPFENCIVMGIVQDKDGIKMSKHLGNVVDPWDVLDSQGADAARWYFYTANQPWLPSRFSKEAVNDGIKKFIGTFWNTYAFYVMYADIDNFDPTKHTLDKATLGAMDRWVLSRLNTLIKVVNEKMDNYDISQSARLIQDFTEELSNWYVRRCRDRYWGAEETQDKVNAYMTLYTVLDNLTRLCAPFVPFMTEEIYQNIVCSVDKDAPISVHLAKYPVADESLIDAKLEEEMALVQQIVTLGHSCRESASIKNRQPLSEIYVVSEIGLDDEYKPIVLDELNIRKIEVLSDASTLVDYSFKPQLRTCGRKFGKNLNDAKEVIANLPGKETYAALKAGSVKITVNGEEYEMTEEDFLIETTQPEGFSTQSSGNLTVSISTVLTEELIEDGLVREMISKIQNHRKETEGLTVSDRIVLKYCGNDKLAEVIEKKKDYLASEVLAVEISNGTGDNSKEWNVNGEKITFSVVKA